MDTVTHSSSGTTAQKRRHSTGGGDPLGQERAAAREAAVLVPTDPRDFQLQLESYFLQEAGRRLEHSPGKGHSAEDAQQELNGFLLLSSAESQ